MLNPFGDAHSTPHRTAAIIALAAGLLALTLRLYFVTHAQVLQAVNLETVRSDASQYYHYAWNIVHRGVYSEALPSSPDPLPDSFRDPGYPLLMALGIKLTTSFDAFYALMLLAQAVLGALTVSLLTLAGRQWLSRWPLTLAALLIAVWPHSVASPAYLLTETLVGFLCAGALLATNFASRTDKPLRWAMAGAIWSLAAMTNAVLIPFAVVLAVVLWLFHHLDRRAALALALSSLILPLGWGIHSSGIPQGSSATSRAVTNLVQGSWPTYHDAIQLAAQGDANGARHLQWMQYEMDTLQKDPAAGLALMRERMAQKPMAHVAWYLWKPALLWAWDIRVGFGDVYVYPTRNSPFFTTEPLWPLEAICYIANPLLAALMLLGAVVALRRRSTLTEAKASAVLVFFVTLVYSILQSEPRYSVPFRGVEMLLAISGAVIITDWLRNTLLSRKLINQKI